MILIYIYIFFVPLIELASLFISLLHEKLLTTDNVCCHGLQFLNTIIHVLDLSHSITSEDFHFCFNSTILVVKSIILLVTD